MAAPRVAPLEPPYPPEVQALFAQVTPPGRPPLNLFRTVARDRRLLQRLFAGGLLDRGRLGLAEREIVILRTCARCGSEYEWGVHVRIFAAKARLTAAQVAATARGGADDPAFAADQALLVRLVDALHDTATLSDELWDALSARWTPEQLLECVMLAGFYTKVAFLTNTFRIAAEPDAPRFADPDPLAAG
jgi:alkylhydroperoxidase family enzyme